MKDYWENTRELFDKYNQIADKIFNCLTEEASDEEDEFFANFSLYLAHALLKDYGTGGVARDELLRSAKIIEDMIAEGD